MKTFFQPILTPRAAIKCIVRAEVFAVVSGCRNGPGVASGDATARSPTPRAPAPPSPLRGAGPDHLLGEGGMISRFIAAGHLPSLILWGPPGCGKTTIARLLAQEMGLHFQALSAVLDGVAELRKQVAEAEQRGAFQAGPVVHR